MNDPYVEEAVSSISRNEINSNATNHKFCNLNGGNFIIGKHEHKILPIFSRKYTLDQGTARQDSAESETTTNNVKYSDTVSKDSDVTLTPLPRRGILKNHISEPELTNIESDSPKPPQHANSDGDLNSRVKYRLHFPNFKRRRDSSQEFVNPAFEPDETVPKDFKFRDLVEHALRQQNDEFLHPFGRSNLYTSVFLGEKPNSDTNGSKLAFWGILLLVLLGISGGIIFMAEMHEIENLQNNTSNGTGPSTAG
ncbi:unnamed protein product [Mytilus coruscus]|uniref:Uncharacterized protein n=1 Tax=Mytilus coruscus TaxID=42192 RepID=A0A6J8A8K9_MYTCO|nr:unnamed protein product [Mytilus coruscus]